MRTILQIETEDASELAGVLAALVDAPGAIEALAERVAALLALSRGGTQETASLAGPASPAPPPADAAQEQVVEPGKAPPADAQASGELRAVGPAPAAPGVHYCMDGCGKVVSGPRRRCQSCAQKARWAERRPESKQAHRDKMREAPASLTISARPDCTCTTRRAVLAKGFWHETSCAWYEPAGPSTCKRCGGRMMRDQDPMASDEYACIACGHREYGADFTPLDEPDEARRRTPSTNGARL